MTNNDFSFGDTLDDLLSGPIATAPRESRKEDFVPAQERWIEGCPACHGTGKWRGFRTCFRCKGAGKQEFKSSPETRAQNRQRAAEKKLRAKLQWCSEHQDIIAWLELTVAHEKQQPDPWKFPISIAESLVQYGSLTDPQLAAVERCMAREQSK